MSVAPPLSRMKNKFLAAKHPANNQAVQRILLRAAYLQHDDWFSFRSMLAAANTLAHLPIPATHMPLRVTPRSRRCSERATTVLQPRALPGVGAGVCRIVGEATLIPMSPESNPSSVSTTRTIRQHHVGSGSRTLTYDDVDAVFQQVYSVLLTTFSGKVQASIIGAHRRGAPYSTVVDVLATHAEVQRDQDGSGLVALAEKANRALEANCSVKPRLDFTAVSPQALPNVQGSHVTTVMRWKASNMKMTDVASQALDNNMSEATYSVVDIDGTHPNGAHEAPSSSTPTTEPSLVSGMSIPNSRVRIRWTTADRYVPQLLFLTGPEEYVSGVLEHAAKTRGLDISMQGIRPLDNHPLHVSYCVPKLSTTWHHIPSELSLFAELRLPYVHPFNRW
jgi:hypothetical protein